MAKPTPGPGSAAVRYHLAERGLDARPTNGRRARDHAPRGYLEVLASGFLAPFFGFLFFLSFF
ncbi:MAG: hypothetical protein K2Y37_17315 [Pirellulales bacterium]|nr:hypothetical protein [Pirellulales bacterium]